MTSWTDLHQRRRLISQVYYGTPGVQTITAPARAAFIRVSMVGAGGGRSDYTAGNLGRGAAFARVKTACAPSDQFSLQIGDHAHAMDAGDALGDSICTKVTGSVVICKAIRGTAAAPGLASGCVGDVKRNGSGINFNGLGGASGTDETDTYGLGFGGGETGLGGGNGGASNIAAGPGGGGGQYIAYQSGGYVWVGVTPNGDGLICVQFFASDPGY